MEQKIIGYKMTKPEYAESAITIAGFNGNKREFLRWNFSPVGNFIENLKKAGVLDLWFEPILEEKKELKIEEAKYYYCIEDFLMEDSGTKVYSKGKIYQAISNGELPDDESDHEMTDLKMNYEYFRLATPEEIEDYNKPKPGDWYICLPGFINYGAQSQHEAKAQNLGGSGWVNDRIFQVESYSKDIDIIWPKLEKSLSGGIYLHAVRKATQQEIDSVASKKLILGDKDIEVIVTKDSIRADGKNIDIESVKKVWKLTQTTLNTQIEINTGWDIFINTVKVGCTVFTSDELHQIIKTYESLQN